MKPKFRTFTDGKRTYAELCGKTIGLGVRSIEQIHDAITHGNPILRLEIELDAFDFLPDGYFDKCLKKYLENTIIGDSDRLE